MTEHAELITSVSDESWLAACKECPEATFFHTPYWADLFEKRSPAKYSKATYSIRFDNGCNVVIPLIRKRHFFGLVTIACSMPAATFGGPVSKFALSDMQKNTVLKSLYRYPNLLLRENPYFPLSDLQDGASVWNDPTQAIDCSLGYDTIWKNAAHSHRKCVRNGSKNGVVITVAQNREEWDRYLLLYAASIERWKKRSIFSGVYYDAPFFNSIEHLDPSLRRLWLAKKDNEIIAGIICFYWNNHVVAWHGAAHAEYFSLYPTNLLYDRALYDAIQGGFRWFDCNPCGGLAGVYKFKEHMGAQPLQSRVVQKRSWLLHVLDITRGRGLNVS